MPYELSELKLVRKKLGITQSELAKLSGLSQSLVAKIEAGKIDPTYSRAKKIIETLQSISGQKELTAKDIANRNIISVSPNKKIGEAIRLMKKHNISQMPVIAHNQSVGLISEALILDCVMEGKKDSKISESMGDAPPVVSEKASATMVSELLKFYPLILVSEEGMLKGVITKSDVIQKAYTKK